LLERNDFIDFKERIPYLPEALVGDPILYDTYWETESNVLLSFMGNILEREFLINGFKEELPIELKITEDIGKAIREHKDVCSKAWKNALNEVDKDAKEKNKISLAKTKIRFDESASELIIDDKEYSLPRFKNNYYVCKILFKRKPKEAVDWSEIYEAMHSDIEPEKSDWRKVYDSVNDINNKVKTIFNTNDNLLTWENHTVKRNF
jgi:hypothetical protein